MKKIVLMLTAKHWQHDRLKWCMIWETTSSALWLEKYDSTIFDFTDERNNWKRIIKC